MKTKRTAFHPAALLGTALLGTALLSSCQWNIGECIRASTARHAGLLHQPQDGKEYVRMEKGFPAERYMYLPEVTFRTEPPLVEIHVIDRAPREALDIRTTGRSVLVNYWNGEEVESIPAYCEQRKCDKPLSIADDRELQRFRHSTDSGTRGSLGAQILAAPFDFCIDPVLSLATTPFYATYAIGCAILYPKAIR